MTFFHAIYRKQKQQQLAVSFFRLTKVQSIVSCCLQNPCNWLYFCHDFLLQVLEVISTLYILRILRDFFYVMK